MLNPPWCFVPPPPMTYSWLHCLARTCRDSMQAIVSRLHSLDCRCRRRRRRKKKKKKKKKTGTSPLWRPLRGQTSLTGENVILNHSGLIFADLSLSLVLSIVRKAQMSITFLSTKLPPPPKRPQSTKSSNLDAFPEGGSKLYGQTICGCVGFSD